MGDDYVSKREAELKAKYHAEMWWIRMGKVFKLLGLAMDHKRNADYYIGEFNKIRGEYVKRGRKAKAA